MMLDYFAIMSFTVLTLYAMYLIIFNNPHECSMWKKIKKDGKKGVWKYSFGGFSRMHLMEYSVKYIRCDGGYVAIYDNWYKRRVIFISDIYNLEKGEWRYEKMIRERGDGE